MRPFNTKSVSNDSHVIAYEIKKLNKMIVAEQVFSDVYTHENSRYFPGFESFFSFDKKVLLLVNAKVQATYDLSQLDIEIDSVNQKIIINSIPRLEIHTYPDVQFYDLEQSSFNSFKKDELNVIKENAVEQIEKKIDKDQLEAEARQQLMDNLLDLYFLAKAYNWEIEDRTPFAEDLEEMFR